MAGFFTGLAGAGAATKGTPRDALAVSVDPRSNTLIVSASPENLVVVREVIKRIDTRDMAANADVQPGDVLLALNGSPDRAFVLFAVQVFLTGLFAAPMIAIATTLAPVWARA